MTKITKDLGYAVVEGDKVFIYTDGHYDYIPVSSRGLVEKDLLGELQKRLRYANEDFEKGRIRHKPRIVKYIVTLEDVEISPDEEAEAVLDSLSDTERRILLEYFRNKGAEIHD